MKRLVMLIVFATLSSAPPAQARHQYCAMTPVIASSPIGCSFKSVGGELSYFVASPNRWDVKLTRIIDKIPRVFVIASGQTMSDPETGDFETLPNDEVAIYLYPDPCLAGVYCYVTGHVGLRHVDDV